MLTQKQKSIESPAPEQRTTSSNMFTQLEDDIAYWLHYPFDDSLLQTYLYNNDLLYPTQAFFSPVTVPPTYLPPCSSKVDTCGMSVSVMSSPRSGYGESAGVETGAENRTEDMKHKDVEFGYHDVINKQSHGGSTSTKRPRSAEHNISERRRRYRINEKMKALQELIPRCNKSDKASMLDEAIKYLKSLQTQLHIMSMGCRMDPMMFLGVQQYITPNPSMGMGMGMGMGTNSAMFPYPVIPLGPSLPNPAVAAATSAAILRQRFPAPGFNMTPVPVVGPTANLSAAMMSSLTLNSQNQPQVLGFADPFQEYHSLHQTKLPIPQKQGGVPPIATKLSSSKDNNNPDHHHQISKTKT